MSSDATTLSNDVVECDDECIASAPWFKEVVHFKTNQPSLGLKEW